jgi:hypothetical protein
MHSINKSWWWWIRKRIPDIENPEPDLWILATNFWDDDGVWEDDDVWKD